MSEVPARGRHHLGDPEDVVVGEEITDINLDVGRRRLVVRTRFLERASGTGVCGVGDRAMPSQASSVAADLVTAQGHHDPVEIDLELGASPGGSRVHRIIAGAEAHVVVSSDTQRAPMTDIRQHWWQRHHRTEVLRDAVARAVSQGAWILASAVVSHPVS